MALSRAVVLKAQLRFFHFAIVNRGGSSAVFFVALRFFPKRSSKIKVWRGRGKLVKTLAYEVPCCEILSFI